MVGPPYPDPRYVYLFIFEMIPGACDYQRAPTKVAMLWSRGKQETHNTLCYAAVHRTFILLSIHNNYYDYPNARRA